MCIKQMQGTCADVEAPRGRCPADEGRHGADDCAHPGVSNADNLQGRVHRRIQPYVGRAQARRCGVGLRHRTALVKPNQPLNLIAIQPPAPAECTPSFNKHRFHELRMHVMSHAPGGVT